MATATTGTATDTAIGLDRAGVGLPWLVRLRWGTIALELGAICLARALDAPGSESRRIFVCMGITAVTNVALARRPTELAWSAAALSGLALSLDVVLFTIILQATGGPSNPFTVLYLVYITLAAVVLSARWTWAIASLAVFCFGGLFALGGSPAAHAGHPGPELLHLQGMWLAFALAAVLTVYFVLKLSAALERRDAEIAAIRERAGRVDRLAALTTLAAGAAHELGTPLGTIALAAGELERGVRRLPEEHAHALAEDTRLIQSELARCRRILDQMSADAGEPAGEAFARLPCATLVDDVLEALPAGDASRVTVTAIASAELTVPRRALAQAIGNLVRNALDATTGRGTVTLTVTTDPRAGARVVVRDDGTGMPADVLAHAGEPFFSTKPAGRGLGLGLFLTRVLIERLGGSLVLDSTAGAGTTATIELPADVLLPRGDHA